MYNEKSPLLKIHLNSELSQLSKYYKDFIEGLYKVNRQASIVKYL